jgi:hypothetical protein
MRMAPSSPGTEPSGCLQSRKKHASGCGLYSETEGAQNGGSLAEIGAMERAACSLHCALAIVRNNMVHHFPWTAAVELFANGMRLRWQLCTVSTHR